MKYVIIGDGIAGATAAEKLREKEQDAEIHVLTDESEPLYNRIMLKTYMKGSLPKQYTRVHDMNWYQKRDIDLHLETKVEKIEKDEEYLETETGETFEYDKLLIATGGSPRKLPQDEGFKNLHYMWTMENAEKIRESAEESETAVVIGGGLLGIDLAMAYAENDAETYYLIKDECWWSRGLEIEGAEIIHEKLREKGVKVITETMVEEIQSSGEEIEKVITDSGEEIETDSVAVAIGQTPNSGIADLDKNQYDMLKTNETLETSGNGIYAAGNMVEYYSPVFEQRKVNGSWDHSEEMGETAALNMAGEKQQFDYVNTYGVGHFSSQFLAIGDWTGEPKSRKYEDGDHYRRLFFRDEKLVGAVLISFTRGQEKIKQMISEKKKIKDKEKLLDKDYWD